MNDSHLRKEKAMSTRARLGLRLLLTIAMTALSVAAAGIAAHAAAPNTYTIGVDNKTPSGHLFQYTDFFPRGGISVLPGDIVDFKWNTGSPDGVHTATLLSTVDLPGLSSVPVVPDLDDGVQLQENPAVDAPSNPSCGTVGSPCPFDGTAQLNSGAFDNAPGHDFYVAINARAGTTVKFMCLIHPAMVGKLSVVSSGASTAPNVDAAATAQYATDTTDALAAEAAVTVPAPTTNSDGTKTWYAQAGAAGPYEQVLEFFPSSLTVAAGDSVKWTTKVTDGHTVTFPAGDASAADDYHHYVCEAGLLRTDTPAAAPPASPCANPADFEVHSTPFPAGGTTLASPATVATSGIIKVGFPLFPDHYTFKLRGAGNYTYQCKVHDHMTGAVSAVP
jgi:plastocyanin